MRFKSESGPQFGDSLQRETEDTYSHLGNGHHDTSEADKTRETAEENTPAVEETPILTDPEGASDDALFGVDERGYVDNLHTDEEGPVIYKNGKRVKTSETNQPIKRKNRSEKKPRNSQKEDLIKDEEKLEQKVQRINEELVDSVDLNLISSKLIKEAMGIDNEIINHLLVSIPGETLVYLDEDKIHTRTMAEVRAEPKILEESFGTEPELDVKEPNEETPEASKTKRVISPDSTEQSSKWNTSQWGGADLSDEIFKTTTKTPNKTIQAPREKVQTPSPSNPVVNENKEIPKPQKESQPSNLEGLFNIAETKDELIAIIAKSIDLESGLQGTHQVYSKDDLIALINATWNGEVGIDHLPRTAGFRENVDRIRENERYHLDSSIAKQKTAEELAPAMQATIEMENELGVPNNEQIYGHNQEDNSFVYNYTNYPRTEENRKKNTGIFGRLWKMFRGQR